MRLRWEYLLVLEILFQGNAARHDGCELDVVHKICAGVFGQVFFDDLASKKANPSDKSGDGRGVHYRLHELVVRHGEVYLGFKICPRPVLSFQLLAPGKTLLVLRHCVFLLLGLLLRQPDQQRGSYNKPNTRSKRPNRDW